MASGIREPEHPTDTGGLIVMVRPDPAGAARAIAAELHASLAIGGEATERALEHLAARQLEDLDLDELAHAMRRAEAVREATRRRVADHLSDRLNTTVAIHPETIRRAAAEATAAAQQLDAAIVGEVRRAQRGRRARRLALVATVAIGAAIGWFTSPLLGLGAAAPLALVVGGSALVARRRPRPSHESLRSHVALTRNRWEQVAGRGADPEHVESIIHRYDPADDVVSTLVAEHPAVRTAERVAVQRRMAWVAAWRRTVGDAQPAATGVDRLLERDRTELWLTDRVDVAFEQPETLVVAAPYADLPEHRARDLHRRLLAVPREQRVIVVLAPDPDAPTGARIPGIGWVPAIVAG